MADDVASVPIGNTAVMHTHNTLPNMAQKYKLPIWKIPSATLDASDKSTIMGNRNVYEGSKNGYIEFANDLISRIKMLGDN